MRTLQYIDADFRALFPAFASTTTYPAVTLQLYWDVATDYISANPQCWGGLKINQQTLALNQLTAHITQLNTLAATGQAGGIVQGATVDKVSVTLVPPPVPNQWRFWLNQTSYGQQLLALLEVASVGGWFLGGYPTPFTLRR